MAHEPWRAFRRNLINQGTNLKLTAVTDASGGYTFTPIRIGTYTVEASFHGFQQAVHKDIVVQVQENVNVSFELEPGAVTQTVQVTAAPPLLETGSASVTAVGTTNYAVLGGAATQAVGPGFHRMDFSLFKEFQTTERTHLEFRAEVFNITNTPQFALPGNKDFTNPSQFTKITGVRDGAYDQREIQFALKFYW